MTPLGQGGSSVLFENIAAIEMALVIEMIVDRGVGGSKLLHGLDVPEPGHRAFSSARRLVSGHLAAVIGSVRNKALRDYWTKGREKGLNAGWIRKLRRIMSALEAADRPEHMN